MHGNILVFFLDDMPVVAARTSLFDLFIPSENLQNFCEKENDRTLLLKLDISAVHGRPLLLSVFFLSYFGWEKIGS